jgi:hypothetical protein
MFHSFVEFIFGCSHKRTTFPITPDRSSGGISRGGTYVACLDCGRELAYDWKNMQIGKPVGARPNASPVVVGRPA